MWVVVPWTPRALPLHAADWGSLCQTDLRDRTWNRQRSSQSDGGTEINGEEKRHSHCDISCSSNYHGVGDQGYAGGLQDGRVFVLIFVDRIEVSHLWVLSAWKWWACRAPLSPVCCCQSGCTVQPRKTTEKENSRTISKYRPIVTLMTPYLPAVVLTHL